jgi:DNA-binding response OmpR family regulator
MSNALVEIQLAAAGFDADAVARIRAILGRTAAQPEPEPEPERLAAGPVEIDCRTRSVCVAGRRVLLALKEFELLCELARDPQRVFTKEELLRTVWGYRSSCRTRTLDSHASRLRKKLRTVDPCTPLVVNVWGVGYRLLELH